MGDDHWLMSETIFSRDGDTYVPTPNAVGPWNRESMHGGPPAGLLARAVEQEVDNPDMTVARLTVDLFRSVPMAPLTVAARTVRDGRRIKAVDASLFGGDTEVARATAVALLRTGDFESDFAAPPPGPDGLPPLRESMGEGLYPKMYIDCLESRALGETTDRMGAWFRMPVQLVEGEHVTPFQFAASMSDFGNLLAGIPGRQEAASDWSFINTDITLNLAREPVSEWICLVAQRPLASNGVGSVQVSQYDLKGQFGSSSHSRLANPR
jgi:Acyl-CoA thioesterase N-terminal domain/Acyl-CoA thioesterase C-terminal domain